MYFALLALIVPKVYRKLTSNPYMYRIKPISLLFLTVLGIRAIIHKASERYCPENGVVSMIK